MGKIMDISGHTYNGIKVISFNSIRAHKTYWNLICHCGNEFIGRSNNLRSGHLKSCGCIKGILTSKRFKKHGDSNKTKEYSAWQSIRKRCYNEREIGYKNYGGRGIKVCGRWLMSYENFLADMGRAPSKNHSIDRINNNGDYEPLNCKWSTREEQSLNKSKTVYISCGTETIPLKTFCKRHQLRYERASYWLKKGAGYNEIIRRSPLSNYKVNPNSKLSKLSAIVIMEALSKGFSLTSIGKYFNTTKGTIWKVKAGYSWASS